MLDRKIISLVIAFIVVVVTWSAKAAIDTNTPEVKLLLLAGTRFTNDLTVGEANLFISAAKGEGVLVYKTGSETNDDPANALHWTKDRVVRADRIAWLCTDPSASALVSRHGIQIQGLRIDGVLDLQSANIPFQLTTYKCAFSDDIFLNRCHIAALSLVNTYFKNLDADGANIASDVLFRNGSKADGLVRFGDATINGSLDCSGSHFQNTNSTCLMADRAKIEANVLLNDSFIAHGEVHLSGATIGGQLSCNGGQFMNPNAVALNVQGATIHNGVYMQNGFQAYGEVLFSGTTIFENLACDDGHFHNISGLALVADGATIQGSVSLRDGFSAVGMLEFDSISVGRNLDCRNADLFNPYTYALVADQATIKGAVLLNGFKSVGGLRLSEISIGGSLACDNGHISNPNGEAINAQGAKINGAVFLRNGFEADGDVRFVGANIGGDLDCSGGRFHSAKTGTPALATDGATIGGYLDLNEGFSAEGEVRLSKTVIRNDLNCSTGTFTNHGAFALSAGGISVGGDLNISAIRTDGEIGLLGATVTGSLIGNGAELSNIGTNCAVLDLQTAKINGALILSNVKSYGQMLLGGVSIGINLDCEGAQLESQNGPALIGDQARIAGSVLLVNGFKSEGEVAFGAANIGSDVVCDDARFIETNTNGFALNLLETEIHGSLVLWTNFFAVGHVNLKSVKVGHILFVNGIKNPDKMTLDLRSAKVGTVFDDENSWPAQGKLFLDNFTYEEFYNDAPTDAKSRIKWLHRQPTNQFLSQPYEQLADVLRKMGHRDDAAQVMILKNEDFARRLPWNSISRLWYNFIGILAGYGYLPGRAFKISVAIIVFGAVLFYLGHRRGFIKSTGSQTKNHSFVYSAEVALAYSVETFVPLLQLGVSKNWEPTNHLWRRYFLMHRFAGWILTTLWIGAFTGLVKT